MSDLTIKWHKCNICHESTSCGTSLSVSERGKSYDVNRRAVYHSLEAGSGYEGLITFCSIINMPCLSLPSYYKMVDTILVAVEAEAHEEMQLADQRVQEFISKENREQANDDTVVDIAVSFDKTWAKRKFTSLVGVVFVIALDAGEVLDYHVLSKVCRKCVMKRGKCSVTMVLRLCGGICCMSLS